jgi:hypothetical protein
MSKVLFGRSKAVERKIDEFFDKMSEAALVVAAEVHSSLEHNPGVGWSGRGVDRSGRGVAPLEVP